MIKLLVFLLSFLILTRFNIDPDLGWHLAIGNRFLQSGEIIRGDQFSWTMPGYEWLFQYLAYQVLVVFLINNLGHLVTGILFGLISSLAVLVLLPARINFWQILVIGLALGIATTNLGVRPHVFSFLFFAILIKLLEKRLFEKPVWAPLYFVLFTIWANFHQGFVVGLLFLIAYLAVDFFWARDSWQKAVKGKGLCILAAVLGTIMTPAGLGNWFSIIKDSAGVIAWMKIAEFQPLVIYFPANIFYAITGVILVAIIFWRFGKIPMPLVLGSAFLFTLPFLASVFAFYWVAIFIFVSSRYLNVPIVIKGDFWAKLPLFFSVMVAFLVLFLNFVASFLESGVLERKLGFGSYPFEAVEFMHKNNLVDNLFNEYAWGGFIDWNLPEAKVFIDGRMAGWRMADGRSILADYLAILKGDCELVERYQIKTALVESGKTPVCFGDFREVYKDEVAQVLVKE